MFVRSKLPENAETVDETMMATESRSQNGDTMVAVSGGRSAMTTREESSSGRLWTSCLKRGEYGGKYEDAWNDNGRQV